MHSSKRKNRRYLIFTTITIYCICIFSTLQGQTAQLDRAWQLSAQGDYEEADTLYHNITVEFPDNIEARIGSAYNHSWNDNPDKAKLEFAHALRLEPANKHALIGLGYALAWNEDFHNAKHPFWKVLRQHPMDEEAVKGLAYVYLWQGKSDVAYDLFAKLNELYPSNPEYSVGLAYAHLQRHETKAAREAIRHAIELVPDNIEYRQLEKTMDRATPLLEVDVWGGYSKVSDDGRIGLRSISLSGQVSKKVRAILQYDNTLTLDNYGFLLGDEHANTYFAGTVVSWNKRHTSRFQYGIRDYSKRKIQSLFIGEHILHLKSGLAIKGGGLYAFGSDVSSEWMANAGVLLPLSQQWGIEPTYFLSSRGSTSSSEHRISLRAIYHNNAFDVSFGGIYGSVMAGENGRSKIYGGFVTGTVPLSQVIWLQGTVQFEKGIPANILIASLGVKVRIEK
jgi:tetratricopeptide (TPR) repeat protein